MLCGYAVMWSGIFFMRFHHYVLWFHHYVMWFLLYVFLASLSRQALVPRLTRYHELVRPVFRWIPVPSLSRQLKTTKWQKQKILFAAKYRNRSDLSLDKRTNDSFSSFSTSRLVRNTALRTSVIDRLLLVKID